MATIFVGVGGWGGGGGGGGGVGGGGVGGGWGGGGGGGWVGGGGELINTRYINHSGTAITLIMHTVLLWIY